MAARIAIVGTGAVGGYVGAHMAQTGEDVTLVDFWPENVETIRAAGLRISHLRDVPEFTTAARALHVTELQRVLTDRGSEFCGNPERHEYELYLAVEDIDHSRTKTKSPQTNGICERFHKTVLNEFYRVAFRKKVYRSIDELQADLDAWITEYDETRPHQGRWCFGKTPMQTFLDAMPMTKEKMIAA